MSTDKATPRPWTQDNDGTICMAHQRVITPGHAGPDGAGPDEREANLALIVEAVNNYDRLTAENERMRAALAEVNSAFVAWQITEPENIVQAANSFAMRPGDMLAMIQRVRTALGE